MAVFLIGALLYTCSAIVIVDIVDSSTITQENLYQEKGLYDE